METSVSYTDRDTAYFSTDEHYMIQRVLKWQKDDPESIEILRMPDDNDGCLYCRLPVRWVRIAPVRPRGKRQLTDEQKQQISETLRKAREEKMRRMQDVQQG